MLDHLDGQHLIHECSYHHGIHHLDEITVKRTKGTKVIFFFQGLHMTHVISMLVYNLKFYILNTPFNIAF
jgi:hypothetical protein